MWVVNESGNAPLRPWRRGGIEMPRGTWTIVTNVNIGTVAPSHPTTRNC
jgi:hypothetical protein